MPSPWTVRPRRRLCAPLCGLLLLTTAAAAAAASAPAPAQDPPAPAAAAPDAKPVTLTLAAKRGDTARYRSVLTMEFGGQEIVVEQVRKETVARAGEKDLALTLESEGGKVTVNGNATDLPAVPSTAVTLNRANRILTFTPESPDDGVLPRASQHLVALIERVVLPDRPVKPGDSWTTEADHPGLPGKKVTITTTYIGEERRPGADGPPALRLKQTVEADTEYGARALKGETFALLDAATGELIASQQTVTGLPSPQGPIGWKGTLQRLPTPEAAPAPAPAKKEGR